VVFLATRLSERPFKFSCGGSSGAVTQKSEKQKNSSQNKDLGWVGEKQQMGCIYSKRKYMPRIWLSELVNRVGQTGDILLFEGTSLFGLFEECVTISPYSHVAMLVRDPQTKRLFVWESSNADDLIDHITHLHKDGPRLVDARGKIVEYLQKYGTGIIYRRLIKPQGSSAFSPKDWSRFKRFMEHEARKHFERNPMDMAESWTRSMIKPRKLDLSTVFCSEEVAYTWKEAGVPLERDPDMYCPQDFSELDQDLFNVADNPGAAGWGLSRSFNVVVDS